MLLTVIYCVVVHHRTVTDGNAMQHAAKIELSFIYAACCVRWRSLWRRSVCTLP